MASMLMKKKILIKDGNQNKAMNVMDYVKKVYNDNGA